ncbi:cytochrome c family protein [Kiloniella laminariae]|uniref:Cytochrome c family protein n=1 Tax=Kiloniella laminariae TaxID=454162 RepID=A0ABT4LHT7_9PROT|nr:cytochrome c family protein [Kiloniella laminariae]MCZ4280659.1 cytochrome c family protein [Kiloniella laminariae]
MKKIALMAFGLTAGIALGLGTAQAGDAAAGEKVFKKCKSCHTIEADGKNKIGPNLFGIIGKAAAAAEGFKYSDAMTESGVTWTEEALTEFLTKPKDFMPGTKMSFGGLKKAEQIEDLIAYLQANS